MLNTGHPMCIFGGPDGACLYTRVSFGRLAQKGTQDPRDGPRAKSGARYIEQVMSGGGATWHENHLVPIDQIMTAVAKMSIGPTAIAQSTTIPRRAELVAFW